jgi:chromosome segregation ATPase
MELVVEALGGDRDEFRALWVAARDEDAPLELPKPAAWVDDTSEEPQPVGELSLTALDAAEQDLQDRAARRSRREGETRQELLSALDARADLNDRIHALNEELGRERGRSEGLRERIVALETEQAERSRHIERLQDELRAAREERLVLLEKLNALYGRRAELYFTWARDEERRRLGAEGDQEELLDGVRELRERLAAAENLLTSVLAERDAPRSR